MINCRGKNGWFEFARFVVGRGTVVPARKQFQIVDWGKKDTITVAIVSKIQAKQPPICIEGTLEDVESLLKDILDHVGRLKNECQPERVREGSTRV